MNKLENYENRGYSVVETEMIYYSPDMDKTVKWFENVLGWYGNVFDRDENNIGTYGFVSDLPQEVIVFRSSSSKDNTYLARRCIEESNSLY